MKIIHGLDTETIDGYCRLLAIDDKIYETSSIYDILYALFESENQTWFMVYNLDYDVSAFLKYLSVEEVKKIYLGIPVSYHNFIFTYYKGKQLKIKHNKKTLYFYDVFHIYNMSLNMASKKYLNEKKLDVDSSQITIDNIYNEETKKYCIQDAVLAKKLFLKWQDGLPNDIKYVKPISTAYYSKAFFKTEIEYNKIKDTKINKLFSYAFYGGRFEVFKRGHFKNVYYYDINSAYPNIIRGLKSLNNAVINYGYTYDVTADYGSYCIDVDIDNKFYGVFPVRINNLLVYPVGVLKGIWLTHADMELLQDYKYKVRYGVNVYANDDKKIFAKKIEYGYEKKKQGLYAYKILLNSLYGKFCQTTDKYYEVKDKKEYNEKSLIYYQDNIYYKFVDQKNSNFIFASEITARTRKVFYELLQKYYDDTLAIFTDCIISTKKLNEIKLSDKIGDFKVEKFDDIYIIGNGVYFFVKDGVMHGHYRGFNLKNADEVFDRIKKSKNAYIDMQIMERQSLLLADNQYEFERYGNLIYAITKKLNLNFDSKRLWYNNFSKGLDVVTGQHNSLAIPIMR